MSSEGLALEALIEGDETEARKQLADYSIGELRQLADRADDLSDLCSDLAKEKAA